MDLTSGCVRTSLRVYVLIPSQWVRGSPPQYLLASATHHGFATMVVSDTRAALQRLDADDFVFIPSSPWTVVCGNEAEVLARWELLGMPLSPIIAPRSSSASASSEATSMFGRASSLLEYGGTFVEDAASVLFHDEELGESESEPISPPPALAPFVRVPDGDVWCAEAVFAFACPDVPTSPLKEAMAVVGALDKVLLAAVPNAPDIACLEQIATYVATSTPTQAQTVIAALGRAGDLKHWTRTLLDCGTSVCAVSEASPATKKGTLFSLHDALALYAYYQQMFEVAMTHHVATLALVAYAPPAYIQRMKTNAGFYIEACAEAAASATSASLPSSAKDVGGASSLPFVPAVTNVFPHVVWTYWDKDELPEVVRMCVSTWTRWNPTYRAIVLTPSNVREFVPTSLLDDIPWMRESPQMQADCVRAYVLMEHGGVWSDATVFCTGPFPAQADMDSGKFEFVGYHINRFRTSPVFSVLENWWFAAAVRSRFMREWATAFLQTRDVRGRIAHYERAGVDTQNIPSKWYLFQHVTAQFVLQKVLPPGFHETHMRLVVDDQRGGPLWYWIEPAQWDISKSVRLLLDFLHKTSHAREMGKVHTLEDGFHSAPALHKLAGGHREHLATFPEQFEALKRVVETMPPCVATSFEI